MHARTRNRTGRKRPGVRERILEAAAATLGEAGIQGFSQVQVARRAGVRQSHITYYFPKRHDLVEALAERFVDDVAHGLGEAAAIASPGGVAEAIGRMAHAIADVRHMRMFTGMIVEADRDPELREVLVHASLRLRSRLAELLGGDDAREHATLAQAALWGLGLHEFLMRGEGGSALTAANLARIAGAVGG